MDIYMISLIISLIALFLSIKNFYTRKKYKKELKEFLEETSKKRNY